MGDGFVGRDDDVYAHLRLHELLVVVGKERRRTEMKQISHLNRSDVCAVRYLLDRSHTEVEDMGIPSNELPRAFIAFLRAVPFR